MTAKYRNVKTDGYDSKAEAKRAFELKLMLRSGLISDFKEQVKFEIIPKQGKEQPAHYIADFTYWENGVFVVEDVKGKRTADYILKRKLMLQVYGISIVEVAA